MVYSCGIALPAICWESFFIKRSVISFSRNAVIGIRFDSSDPVILGDYGDLIVISLAKGVNFFTYSEKLNSFGQCLITQV